MSDPCNKSCPNRVSRCAKNTHLDWAHWKGFELKLEPAEQLTLNAIAALVNDDRYCLLTADDLHKHTRLKRRTTGSATQKLAELGLIRLHRTRPGLHCWLECKAPRKATPKAELFKNTVIRDAQNIPISDVPDAQNIPISDGCSHPDAQKIPLSGTSDAVSPGLDSRAATEEESSVPIEVRTHPLGSQTDISIPASACARARAKLFRDPPRWDEFVDAYPPSPGSLHTAKLAYAQVLAEGIDPQILIEAVRAYPFSDGKYTIHPVNWLNERRWECKTDGGLDPVLRAAGITPDMVNEYRRQRRQHRDSVAPAAAIGGPS